MIFIPVASETSAASSGFRPSSIGQGSTKVETPKGLQLARHSISKLVTRMRSKRASGSKTHPGHPMTRCRA